MDTIWYILGAVLGSLVYLRLRSPRGNKTCPHCGMKIRGKATICPYCRSKQKNSRYDVITWIILMMFGAAILVTIADMLGWG